jgi:ABC-2 type transport system permease protein
MADESKAVHDVPSDFKQVPIVWRYELLKYLRSKRLLASMAIAVVVLSLIYILPPALGTPYSGTDSNRVVSLLSGADVGIGLPGLGDTVQVGLLNRSQIDLDTLVIFVNGTELPSGGMNWTISKITYQGQSAYAVVFLTNVTGKVITASYEWFTSPESFESIFLNFASILVVICATFFGADALVSEFQNRTGYLIFPNPMKRGTLYFGKYAASMTAGIMVMGLFYVGIAILSLISARGIDADFGLSFLFSVEYLMAAMAVAYLISTLLKGTTGATVLTFFLFIMILPIVDSIAIFTGAKFDASLTFAAGVIGYILLDPYPTDWTQSFAGFEFNNFYPAPATAAIVMLAYAAAAIAISLVLFKRKQLAG